MRQLIVLCVVFWATSREGDMQVIRTELFAFFPARRGQIMGLCFPISQETGNSAVLNGVPLYPSSFPDITMQWC